MAKLQATIFCTLAYADVFDYPLSSEELYRFLITDKVLNYFSFKAALTRIQTNEKRIDTNGEYFFLKGRKKIVTLRKKKEKWSQEKLRIARRVAKWLRLIPWIKMVAVTGALAMRNSDKKDDIDLLIITSKNRLWLTRLLAVLMVELVADRRRPNDKKIKDKICLNMFLDENHLTISKKEQDLFSAHEVCQARLLWGKEGIYQKFIKANQWTRRFLPNWKP